MIHEIATLPVHADGIAGFREAFDAVAPLLARAPGHAGHLLAQGIESPTVCTLIVRWQTLADHRPGFEASADHAVFMARLAPYLAAEPTVQHVQGVASAWGGIDMQSTN
ncbi:antibiotic biosynthesis monooxygenase [Stenotrophomonas sp.]|uniref:antibiotic biosynthesis monooxygenase family protein n=1 Tax=Stenotrophomonas sp. TaxID=69392 RepID=UPI002FCCAF07